MKENLTDKCDHCDSQTEGGGCFMEWGMNFILCRECADKLEDQPLHPGSVSNFIGQKKAQKIREERTFTEK